MSIKEFSSHRWEWNPPQGFIDFQIAPLSNTDVHLFIERWHKGLSQEALHPDIASQIDNYPRSLIKTIEDPKHSDVKALCKIPLLCALVCIVNLFSFGRLPESLRKLYFQSVRILSQTRDEVRNVPAASEYKELNAPARTDILGHIALTMQEGADRKKGQMVLEVSKNDVIVWIDNYKKRRSDPTTSRLTSEDILRFYTERTNILREPTVGRIDFIHRSFLEFLGTQIYDGHRGRWFVLRWSSRRLFGQHGERQSYECRPNTATYV
jgi:predicted NACHT family NTPase